MSRGPQRSAFASVTSSTGGGGLASFLAHLRVPLPRFSSMASSDDVLATDELMARIAQKWRVRTGEERRAAAACARHS
jgi:hypothetical protein